jgi:hypothetical protein
MELPQKISSEDLQRVRWAKGVFAPKGKMYWINTMNNNMDIQTAVQKAIKKTVYEMMKVPFPLNGVKGIHWLARDLKKWPRKHGNETAAFYLGQIIRMSEDFGTGGAGFRYIYGAFLKETSEKFNNPDLMEASVLMGNAANHWRDFAYVGARNCKNRSKPEEDYGKLSDMLHEIADLEKQVYVKLDKIKI